MTHTSKLGPGRRLFGLLLLTAAIGVVALFGASIARADDPFAPTFTGTPTPSIQSDQADYSPGSLVTLTGANWQPGENVHLFVNDDVGQTWSHVADIPAPA